MAHQHTSSRVAALVRNFGRLSTSDPLMQCLAPRLNRSFATTVDIPVAESSIDTLSEATSPPQTVSSNSGRVLTTLYSWPELEPRRFTWYSSQHLDLPLRRDILHRAVIYEADVHRGWSTASTKWRKDVHGSNRKIAPQKGMGRARVGDKKSPIRRGGGVAFGPHPRDFSTELPKKIYDIAWRTALSHRYRKGELIVLDDPMTMPLDSTPWLLENIFDENKWGKTNGRSLLVADRINTLGIDSVEEENLARLQERLFTSMAQIGKHGSIKDLDDVDVKDLLETGRVIIDQQSLDNLIARHSSDMKSSAVRVC